MNTATFISLETPRLILRRFRASDLVSFMAYRNDLEVARYQSWESITRAEAVRFIAQQSRHRPGIPGKWFQFAAEVKAGGALAGDCALLVIRTTPRIGELGYTFARAYQHSGLATEAARAVIDFAFDTLALNRVIATTDCRNAPFYFLVWVLTVPVPRPKRLPYGHLNETAAGDHRQRLD